MRAVQVYPQKRWKKKSPLFMAMKGWKVRKQRVFMDVFFGTVFVFPVTCGLNSPYNFNFSHY
jgi:hypothetical protein